MRFSRQNSNDVDGTSITIVDYAFVLADSERVRRGDDDRRLPRVLKQSSPQISVASRLLSPVPKSHPHTLKTSRSVRAGWSTELGVSWSATYLHPNIKPLRLVPIILDKRQDSMMYCRGAYRVSSFAADFPDNRFVRVRVAHRRGPRKSLGLTRLSVSRRQGTWGEGNEIVSFIRGYI